MAIMRWRPWGDLLSVEDEMNQLFGDFFDRVPERRPWALKRWSPAVDISENKDSIHVDVEIPGMKKEDIRVSLENNVLMLKGEKKQEREINEQNCHRLERRYGSFVRSFELPMPVQADKIKASYKNGVLHVELPKAEEVKPKEIPIEVK
ncbi:Hsp20/alpha crystallin family protein [bacterium]|nr:Hsp20/alpha crystallin family protein [bacterium]